jgi:hypothetical protein
MRSRLSLVIVVLTATFCVGAAYAQDSASTPIIAVFDIEDRKSGLNADEIMALGDYQASKLGEGGCYRIVPRGKIHERLREQKAESHKTCYDQSCQIELGRELAAQFTVSTSISRLGNTCIVTAAIFDLKKAATLKTASAKAACQAEGMLAALDTIVAKLSDCKTGGRALVAPKKDGPEGNDPIAKVEDPIIKKLEQEKAGQLAAMDKPPESEFEIEDFFFGGVVTIAPSPDLALVKSDATNSDVKLTYGVNLTFEWRIIDYLLLGFGARPLFTSDLTVTTTSLRFGGFIEVTERFVVTAIGIGGLSGWKKGDAEMDLGFHLGAEVGFWYFFSKSFGLGGSLGSLYESKAVGGSDQVSTEGTGIILLTSLGVMIGF